MVKVHTALFVLCAAAVLGCAGLFVPVLASTGPERAEPVAGARPSPTPTPPSTRAAGQQHCLVGSWRSVDESMMIKFYTDADPFPFTASGRYYEFHPDGTGVERNDNVQYVGSFRGSEVRQVANGWREFTWSATDETITYHAITNADLTSVGFDRRGQRETIREQQGNPNYNSSYAYACAGTRLVESNTDGYRSAWARTADHGVYG
jgi:hypothetical protein